MFGVGAGDTLVLDLSEDTFAFEKKEGTSHTGSALVGKEPVEMMEDAAAGQEAEGQIPLRGQTGQGKAALEVDLTRTKRLVAQYFEGLGVPQEVLERELAKLGRREDRDSQKADVGVRGAATTHQNVSSDNERGSGGNKPPTGEGGKTDGR